MKKAALVSVVLMVAGAVATAPNPVQAKIQAKYDAMSKAFKDRDITVFDRTMGREYTWISPSGDKRDRDWSINDLRRQMSRIYNPQWRRSVTRLSAAGPNVVVYVRAHFTGRFGKPGKLQDFDLVSTSSDTWTQRGRDWVLIRSETATMSAKINGISVGPR